eukprot:TRINITY_DN10749_c1_g1_i4.p2 TRINITY_DN10749_c1_g1~~TRINITY_DN10749_c1_g1_i4.p2  ORF type:complete len:113 (-),score=24.78 TRINITY_DN10749_c1_g1_i4:245-583(-)
MANRQHIEAGCEESLLFLVRPHMHHAIAEWMKQAGEHEKRGILRLARMAHPHLLSQVPVQRSMVPQAAEFPYHLKKAKLMREAEAAFANTGSNGFGGGMQRSSSTPGMKMQM